MVSERIYFFGLSKALRKVDYIFYGFLDVKFRNNQLPKMEKGGGRQSSVFDN